MLCERSEDVPHENSVPYHPRTKPDLETPERVDNILLQKDILDTLPQQMGVCADLHLRPYYSDEDDMDGLYHLQVKRGTIAFHAYAMLYARMKSKRYTPAACRFEDGNITSSVPAELLSILDGLGLGVKAVYLNHEFYDSKCLTLFQTHSHAYVMPIIHWGRIIKREFSEGQSRAIQHSLATRLDGHSWTAKFPIHIGRTYQNGRRDEHGVAHHDYAAGAPFIDSP